MNGVFGAGYTSGIQSSADPRFMSVIVTLKHWAAYSFENLGNVTRYNFNAIVSNATLADTYFPAFRAAVVTGGATGVMCR